jgi:hypothetical protein
MESKKEQIVQGLLDLRAFDLAAFVMGLSDEHISFSFDIARSDLRAYWTSVEANFSKRASSLFVYRPEI